MTTSPQNSHSRPWLTAACCALSMVAFFLGLLGFWPTYGPSIILALFCAAGPVAGLWFRAKGWRVDITGLFASCALVLLSILAFVPWLIR